MPSSRPTVRCTMAASCQIVHEGLRRVWEYELSTQSHSMTGLAGDVLEKLPRAQPAGEADPAQ